MRGHSGWREGRGRERETDGCNSLDVPYPRPWPRSVRLPRPTSTPRSTERECDIAALRYGQGLLAQSNARKRIIAHF